MKRAYFLVLLVLLTSNLIAASQEKDNQDKEKVKPVLLVIDVQNQYFPMMSEEDIKAATFIINECWESWWSGPKWRGTIFRTDFT